VRNLFLAEAALLSGVGGAAGIVVAVSLGGLVRLALPAVPFATPPAYAAAALSTAVAVGLVAGVAPARRAAGLDPVENLRAE
jgi:putative ABC transport system permease protein